jgi:hypothetical protein
MASYKISLSNFIEQTLYQRKTQKYKRLKWQGKLTKN